MVISPVRLSYQMAACSRYIYAPHVRSYRQIVLIYSLASSYLWYSRNFSIPAREASLCLALMQDLYMVVKYALLPFFKLPTSTTQLFTNLIYCVPPCLDHLTKLLSVLRLYSPYLRNGLSPSPG